MQSRGFQPRSVRVEVAFPLEGTSMTQFIIQSGKHTGKRLSLSEKVIVIGRDENCQIRLNSEDVSRKHCRMEISPDGITVRDLGSRNGTFVNELAVVEETKLSPGDQLRVGPLILEVPRGRKAAAKTAPPPSETSDDDIASWLNASEDEATADSGDSTIILKRDSLPPAQKQTDTEAKDNDTEQPAPQKPRKNFKSIAEEAADIIRRHHERLKRGE
ncbi:MAG: hypothetical protein Tsb009_21860 [Planctomycetaceae bacterium]